MPTYDITSPDGKKYRVTAPEGASQADVLNYAKQNYSQAKAPGAFDYVGNVKQQFGEGITDIKRGLSPERIEESAGQILPSAPLDIAGGAFKAATAPFSAASRMFGGAVEKGTGGMVTEDQAETALMGLGAETGPFARAISRTGKPPPAPSTDALDAAASAGYQTLDAQAAQLQPHVVERFADSVIDKLQRAGFREYNPDHGPVFRAVNELKEPLPGSTTTATTDIEAVRQVLNRLARNPAQREAARQAIEEIDNYLTNIPHISAEAKETRGNYAAARRSDRVTEAAERGELNAASSGSGANLDNALRQRIKGILTDPKKSRGFNADELELMDQIVRGTPLTNLARLLSKLGPSHPLSGWGTAITADLAGGSGLATATLATGAISQWLAERSTAAGISKLDNMVRARSPLGKAAAAAAPVPASVDPKALGAAAIPIGAGEEKSGGSQGQGRGFGGEGVSDHAAAALDLGSSDAEQMTHHAPPPNRAREVMDTGRDYLHAFEQQFEMPPEVRNAGGAVVFPTNAAERFIQGQRGAQGGTLEIMGAMPGGPGFRGPGGPRDVLPFPRPGKPPRVPEDFAGMRDTMQSGEIGDQAVVDRVNNNPGFLKKWLAEPSYQDPSVSNAEHDAAMQIVGRDHPEWHDTGPRSKWPPETERYYKEALQQLGVKTESNKILDQTMREGDRVAAVEQAREDLLSFEQKMTEKYPIDTYKKMTQGEHTQHLGLKRAAGHISTDSGYLGPKALDPYGYATRKNSALDFSRIESALNNPYKVTPADLKKMLSLDKYEKPRGSGPPKEPTNWDIAKHPVRAGVIGETLNLTADTPEAGDKEPFGGGQGEGGGPGGNPLAVNARQSSPTGNVHLPPNDRDIAIGAKLRPDATQREIEGLAHPERSGAPQPLSDDYRQRIKKLEGFNAKPFWDVKQWTVGWGTKAKGPDERPSVAELQQRFDDEINAAAAAVDRVNPNLDDGTRAALVSLTYNVGPGWAQHGLGQVVRRGDSKEIARAMQAYANVSGKHDPAIARRRQTEAQWIAPRPPGEIPQRTARAHHHKQQHAQRKPAPVHPYSALNDRGSGF